MDGITVFVHKQNLNKLYLFIDKFQPCSEQTGRAEAKPHKPVGKDT